LKLVLHHQLTAASTQYDIMQLVKTKQDYEKVNIVINGGAGTSSKPSSFQRDLPRVTANNKTIKVAAELAAAHIPVILNPFRGAPWQWQNLDSLVGPPLTKSSARVLADAGVTFGIAMGGMSMFFFPPSFSFEIPRAMSSNPHLLSQFLSPAGAFAIYG
jgi:hypothetical protein